MCEKIRKYPVVSSFLTVLTAFALLKGMPGSGRAAEIIKLAVLSAAMLYIMYLASGKEIFRWEKGSLGKSIRLYKSMLIISFIIVAFITSAGNDRKVKDEGRNWKRQRDDAVICA
jgi:hypothetical protein